MELVCDVGIPRNVIIIATTRALPKGEFKKRSGKTSFWKIRILLNLAPKGVGFATPVDKNASGDDFGCWRALTGTPFAAI